MCGRGPRQRWERLIDNLNAWALSSPCVWHDTATGQKRPTDFSKYWLVHCSRAEEEDLNRVINLPDTTFIGGGRKELTLREILDRLRTVCPRTSRREHRHTLFARLFSCPPALFPTPSPFRSPTCSSFSCKTVLTQSYYSWKAVLPGQLGELFHTIIFQLKYEYK